MLRSPDLVGRALDNRYELLALLGEGAFGWVYEGRDRRLHRAVAVKVIKPWWAQDGEWVRRFEREAQMLARVNDPGIVQIFDFGHAEEGPYYVAELVDGESLEQRLRRGTLPAVQARAWAQELARALGSAHARGIVHCDVKPANVLIACDGRIKVGDFGVARLAEGTSQALSATVAGTPRYMAPEQARGGPRTPATDVYSAGVVLYEMLAGKPPFAARSALELALRHLQQLPPALPPEIPSALRAVVERALAKDPADRFAHGAAMSAALHACESTGRAQAARAASAPTEAAPTLDLRSTSTPPTIPRRPLAAQVPRSKRTLRVAPRTPLVRIATLLVAVLASAVGLAALLLAGAGASTTVPELRGLPVGGVHVRAQRAHVQPMFSRRYAAVAAGIAVAQTPAPGRRVSDGSTVRVVLSAGPPPVRVPDVVGLSSASARSLLATTGLRYAVNLVAAPGSRANVVLRQIPQAAATAPHGSTVALSVAEPPRWRALTTFTGVDSGQSVPVGVRGDRWRVRYHMSYQGTCLLLFTCLGPSARARDLKTDTTLGNFDLGEGSYQTHTFNSGPGLYRVEISGGTDAAEWSMTVEDYY